MSIVLGGSVSPSSLILTNLQLCEHCVRKLGESKEIEDVLSGGQQVLELEIWANSDEVGTFSVVVRISWPNGNYVIPVREFGGEEKRVVIETGVKVNLIEYHMRREE